MAGGIIPSRLYQVKIFESAEKFVVQDGGRRRLPEESDDILETQISRWVEETKSFVVGTGPISVFVSKDGEVITERRTASVIYAPPVGGNQHAYGEQPAGAAVREMAEDASSGDAVTDRWLSDGPSS